MNDMLLKMYQLSPYPVKVLAASLKGWQLRKWRYGRSLDNLLHETLAREFWEREKWVDWQEERLAFVLHRAATQVPYYQNYWRERRRGGDKASWDLLSNWPVLNKGDVKNNPKAFVAEDCEIGGMYVDRTSGTTGQPLEVYESQKTTQQWYAIYEGRIRHWHNVSINESWGIFGGQLVTEINRQKPPYWVRNLALNQTYFSTFHISEATAKDYIQAIIKFNISHLVVYPSSLTFLAALLIELGLTPPKKLKVIFSNAEILLPQQKDIIESAFQCPVINTYGMGEKVFGASECQYHKMHTWPESGVAEIWDEDEQLVINEQNQVGDFIFTGLMNPDMPLIRYRLGDRGTLPNWTPCSCGRSLPVLERLEGRSDDMITTPSGRKLFWFNTVFYGKPIVESQIVQEAYNHVVVSIVPDSNFSEKDEIDLKQAMQDRVGEEIKIDIKRVYAIPRTKAGKLQTIISYVD